LLSARGIPYEVVALPPAFRYGRAELEVRKQTDGEPVTTPLADWALRHRFVQPGTHQPLGNSSMPNKHPRMRLSPEEGAFLRRWIYDSARYQDGAGPAKRLQVQHRVRPADLAVVIAAAFPDLGEQEAAALGPPAADAPPWPWSDEALRERLAEARTMLA
jgi:hypothetical protein